MKYYKTEKPDTEFLNKSLEKKSVKLYEMYNEVKKQSLCDHNWEMKNKEIMGYDGNDLLQFWVCEKCEYIHDP